MSVPHRWSSDPDRDVLLLDLSPGLGLTSTGGRLSESNVRNRILGPAVERANERLVEDGCEPIPDGLTPHSLRRTFAWILVALGENPTTFMRRRRGG